MWKEIALFEVTSHLALVPNPSQYLHKQADIARKGGETAPPAAGDSTMLTAATQPSSLRISLRVTRYALLERWDPGKARGIGADVPQ